MVYESTYEPNIELLLCTFYCEYHKDDGLIVNRGPGVFIMDCGCAYRMDIDCGVQFINTTQPDFEEE